MSYLIEQRQRDNDARLRENDQREADRRFATPDTTPAHVWPEPKRYRYFSSGQAAYGDPVVGPLMKEEDKREREGLPPRFCLC